ncbi:2-C-methyl-D-erythritol 2,4-cyclodiphosphate synthase [Bifidobacterium gallicum]|uniref:2-C-methyl-D-erythritol 2,4-cyclodiphosphate synthase n=1 Tax=Bifidobacterium gallicum DSM 20093 = LMG 11596 TaxID=561180 RepID=D1NWU3_9BIFI|nr:2-C-methyl-D-erythritol 2,4-cyclodiphosphate synthase [Bifidobacterium gallicum]EFA22152.1 2-C-methyl-D-erythritol 2,4-cyclodiphosphate synthase [Bifidobacterium gallicum DSM 20093 = LMG 11596]KFI57492.1 2-C-methyl-D-erythritol 2,4-cyclodiphosphate synthase [Bifidobacterium gallicum DSM 20093 = LMG 11596]
MTNNHDLRVGVGFDAHRFIDADDPRAAEPMHLACLLWPGPGIQGDSDGDVVVHALIDALLSAADLGDIGSYFGVGADSQGAGRTGRSMLQEIVAYLDDHGAYAINASVCIVGNRPKFSARRREAQQALSSIMGCSVTVTATTTDGMGFTGKGEGIAAIANCLVELR